MILGEKYLSYGKALMTLNIPTLTKRRETICRAFASKTANNNKFSAWFIKTNTITRTGTIYIQPFARTTAYKKSPLFYLIELLNNP